MSNTPYDDVFRTLVTDGSQLLLPLLNEVFGEHYTGSEKIEFYVNEQVHKTPDGEEERKITDAAFTVTGMHMKKYHLECESKSISDKNILVRFFEYDTYLALKDHRIEDGMLVVDFPHSAVLALRSTKFTPDIMKVRINTPGTIAEYSIPVIKMKSYSLDALFDKKLYFLLPFYMFNLEHNLENYENDEEKLASLKDMLINIRDRIWKLKKDGLIDAAVMSLLITAFRYVAVNLARNYVKVRKGVEETMVGKLIDYEARTIKEEGRKEGRREGRREGRKEAIEGVILQMLRNGFSINQIALAINEPESNVESIVASAQK